MTIRTSSGSLTMIARDTRTELDSSLVETRALVDALTRELRIVAELPGRHTISQSLPRGRSETKASRQTAASLLRSITPLAEALHPPPAPLSSPGVVCTDTGVDVGPYLRVLRWFMDDEEEVCALGLPDRSSPTSGVAAVIGGAKDKLSTARDRPVAKTLVVVTDRRVLTADSVAFLEEGDVSRDIPIDGVRYVRYVTPSVDGDPSVLDLITREENLRWTFPASVAPASVGELSAVLAKAMNLPDEEREALQRRTSSVAVLDRPGEAITGGSGSEPVVADDLESPEASPRSLRDEGSADL